MAIQFEYTADILSNELNGVPLSGIYEGTFGMATVSYAGMYISIRVGVCRRFSTKTTQIFLSESFQFAKYKAQNQVEILLTFQM